jgi:superfamily II DNA or RNA helicase
MITININNVYCQIIGLTDTNIINVIDDKLSYYVAGYNFTWAYKTARWNGKQHLLNKQLKFQTGLLSIVEDILKYHNLEYQLEDKRIEPVLGKEIKLNLNYYTPRDYQFAIVDACLKEKCGIVKAATGSGKSLSISMLIGKTNIKTVVYVVSIDLLYQTKKAIEEALNIEVGVVGDGQCIIKKITVALPMTIMHGFDKDYEPFDDDEGKIKKENLDSLSKIKIQKMVENAQMFIFDEAQYLSAITFQLIAKNSKNARYRYGFSGTPWRDDGADLGLTAATGKQLIDIDATSLINKNVLVSPKIYFFNVPEIDGYEASSHNKKPYPAIYDVFITNNEIRNKMVIESLEKLYNKGRKVLILIRRKKHGLNLLEMVPKHIRAYFLSGDANSDEREAVKELFNADGVDVIIASQIFDVGIDLPKLDALILAGGGKSSTRALQRIGRIIRSFPGKKDAVVVDLIDNCQYLFLHSRKRHKIYKTEPAFQIKLPDGINW